MLSSSHTQLYPHAVKERQTVPLPPVARLHLQVQASLPLFRSLHHGRKVDASPPLHSYSVSLRSRLRWCLKACLRSRLSSRLRACLRCKARVHVNTKTVRTLLDDPRTGDDLLLVVIGDGQSLAAYLDYLQPTGGRVDLLGPGRQHVEVSGGVRSPEGLESSGLRPGVLL